MCRGADHRLFFLAHVWPPLPFRTPKCSELPEHCISREQGLGGPGMAPPATTSRASSHPPTPPQMLMLLSLSWLPGSSAHVGPGGHPGLHHPRLAAGPALLWHVWVQVRGLHGGRGAPKAPGGPKNFTATPSSPGARDLALPRARLPSTAEQAQVPAAITSLLSFQAEPEVGGENPQPQQEPPVPGRTRLGGRPGW